MWLNRLKKFVSLNRVLSDSERQAKTLKNDERDGIEGVIYGENEKKIVGMDVEIPLRYEDIIQVDFPENLYFKEQTNKKQIVLHHTVSGRGVQGDINWWKQNPQRIATCVIIDWKGDIYQLFSSRYWAHHLGVRAANNVALNKASIGVEIDAWGALVKENRHWYPALWDGERKMYLPNKRVEPIKNVQKYTSGYRGFYGYEKYTDEQIESLRKLLIYWGDVHNIPLHYNDNMFMLNSDALLGTPGIWSHTSYRTDKSDVHPQPELIEMLKSLT